MTDGREGCYIYRRISEGEEIWVICNFEKENRIQLAIQGEVLLSNSDRKEISGVYAPYECAVIRR